MKNSRKCLIIIFLLLLVALPNQVEIDSKIEQEIDYTLQPDSMTVGLRWEGEIDVVGDVFSTPLVVDMDHDGQSEILCYSYHPSISYGLYCFNTDGSYKWSREASSFSFYPTPTVLDVNRDGFLETLFVDEFNLYCIDINNQIIWSHDFSLTNEKIVTSPMLVNNQPTNNIFLTTNVSTYLFYSNGAINRKRALFSPYEMFSPVLFDNSGFIAGVDQLTDFIFLTDTGGEPMAGGWISCRRETRSPAVSDFNDDSQPELIYQDTDGNIKCKDVYFFTNLWTFFPNDMIDGPPAIADLDNDGSLEVLVKTENYVFCLDESGNMEWNYSLISSYLTYNPMAIADLDGDSTLEIIFQETGSYNLTCISHNGTKEWSMNEWDSEFSSPAIADIDGDGIVEIITGINEKLACLELTDVSQSGNQTWTAYQGSVYHTGNFDYDGDFIDDYTEISSGTDAQNSDSDSDLVPDGYEIVYNILPNVVDTDGDGLEDGEELYTYDTLPFDSDTDNDWLSDGMEISTYSTDPLDPDCDTDGLIDGEEVTLGLDGFITDPFDSDCDDDGLLDGEEYTYGSNPHSVDSDIDNLLDYDEVNVYGTDPSSNDTDSDSVDDAWEVTYGTNPLVDDSASDPDLDYLTNLDEYGYGTNPVDYDTDDDLLWDGVEIKGVYSPSNPGANATGYVHTNPLEPDSDGDTFIDSVEIFSNSNPNDPLSIPEPVTITPPPETITITPPPETITQNETFTTTVEAGIIMVASITSFVTVLTIIVVLIRKKRK